MVRGGVPGMSWFLAVLLSAVAIVIPRVAAAEDEAISVSDETTLKLLEALDQQQMPDVVLWILDRAAADTRAGKTLKQEVAFRRASALVGVSQSEGDAEKRAALLDKAQQALDGFLASDPPLERRIDALMQKGGLLIARGRVNLEKAKRPAADAGALRAAAVPRVPRASSAVPATISAAVPVAKVPAVGPATATKVAIAERVAAIATAAIAAPLSPAAPTSAHSFSSRSIPRT